MRAEAAGYFRGDAQLMSGPCRQRSLAHAPTTYLVDETDHAAARLIAKATLAFAFRTFVLLDGMPEAILATGLPALISAANLNFFRCGRLGRAPAPLASIILSAAVGAKTMSTSTWSIEGGRTRYWKRRTKTNQDSLCS